MLLACLGVSAVTLFSGCAAITPQRSAPPETSTEAVPLTLQSENQSETVMQTETTSKKEVSLKDIQVSIEKGGRKGNVNFQLEDNTGTKEITQAFLTSSSAFFSQDDRCV